MVTLGSIYRKFNLKAPEIDRFPGLRSLLTKTVNQITCRDRVPWWRTYGWFDP